MLLTSTLLSKRLARLGGLEDLNAAQIQALARLASWHDLGKCNHKFQRGEGGHLSQILDLLGDDETGQGDRLDELLPEIHEPLLLASFAHHGWPLNQGRYEPSLWKAQGGVDPLNGIDSVISASADWFPDACFETLPQNSAFAHAVNGLITLADWLGSDERFFPLLSKPVLNPPAYFEKSLDRAAYALAQIGLAPSPVRPNLEAITFADISEFSPRPAQSALWSLPTQAPSLAILEAATGSGKTEAALGRFLRLFAAGEVDGLYFALPTRAAATQLHGRVYAAVQRALGSAAPPVVLAVPGYHRVDDFEGQALPSYQVRWDRPGDRLRGWASEQSKRFLGASIAVGTVDQALSAGIKVKHAHLRGTPLLRSLLVVDEVHASDTYMNRILKGILARQLQAGGHALLLSATLGSARRLELIHADLKRPKRRDRLSHGAARATAYPLLSYRSGADFGEGKPSSTGQEKPVQFETQPWMPDSGKIAKAALAEAQRGGRILVIRNTVRGCIEVQRAVEALGGGDLTLHCGGMSVCHHSRYAPSDRRRLDRAVEAALNPHGPQRGVIVVATQTVEQSLDIDADLLITDLCPMDVLLQRVGRLHRHTRTRPVGFESARVIVLTPSERNLSAFFKSRRGRSTYGLGPVYPDMRIIEATWRAMESTPGVSIPRDARVLVEDSTHPEVLKGLSELSEAWSKHQNEQEGVDYAARKTAELHRLDWSAADFGDEPFPRDKRIGSRLGELDRMVKLEPRVMGPLGAEIKALRIPHYLLSELEVEGDLAERVRAEKGGLRFFFGIEFFYDRFGLRAWSQEDEQGGDDV